ncbi:MAG: hypothetical protein GQE15_36500 [Archangiaceae bacterium]|nr:hypothetical protein [Archangiaceae bacterium]
MPISDDDRIEFARQMAASGASFEDTFVAFRRTGTGYIHAILAVRNAFPASSLFEARDFFERRFGLDVLELSSALTAALRSALPDPENPEAARVLVSCLRRPYSPLAIAAHFEAAWGVPWRPVYETARLMQPADDASAAVTQDLLEEHGLSWEAELAAIAPRV